MGMIILVNGFAQASLDPDAQAFITAAGITNATQKSAINQLVLDMKAASIWTLPNAIYPFVGGTATTNKYNLKDPRDLDAAFRLTFNGGWTHGANGSTPNGSTGYADTNILVSAELGVNNTHLSFYSRTDEADGNTVEMGAYELSIGDNIISLSAKRNGVGVQSSQYETTVGQGRVQIANANSQGWYMGTRTGVNNHDVYKNGSAIANNTDATGGHPGNIPWNLTIGARNLAGTIDAFSAKELAFASIGDGLNSTQAAAYYTAVQAFQTTLSRQV